MTYELTNFNSPKRDRSRKLRQDQALWDHYSGRIARSGTLKPSAQKTRWYCFECGQHFLQTTRELVSPKTKKPTTPRCMCPPHDRQRFDYQGNSKSRGHMCCPPWHQDDYTTPEQMTKRPEADNQN